MTNRTRYPVYAVIARASEEVLAAAVSQARQALKLEGDDWEIQEGLKTYCALWDFSEAGGTEYAVAEAISKQISGKVYVAQLEGHLRGSYAYERGKALGEVPEGPEKLATRLGVPFPLRPVAVPGHEWSVVVVEGAAPAAVEPALALDAADRKVVKLEDHPLGTLLYASDGSRVTGLARMVAGPGLDAATAYSLEVSYGGALMRAWIYRAGTMVQFFTSDDSYGLGPPFVAEVRAIKGAETPAAIADALHVPRELLGLGHGR